MRQRLADWTETYAPPTQLQALSRVLTPEEWVPTLFRYPCPHGLMDFDHGRLTRLGPSYPWLWMASSLDAMQMAGPRQFGALVLLQPLSFTPCEVDQPGCYLGVNRDLDDKDDLLWVPPVVADSDLPWDDLKRSAEVREAYGTDAFDAALFETRGALRAYVEELLSLIHI